MKTAKKIRSAHRGANGNELEFARRFISDRVYGFCKDMRICLTAHNDPVKGETHAYFPALAACCSMLEYLTGLHRGNLRKVDADKVKVFARDFLPQPDYSADIVEVLFEGFRNRVNHYGIASGVWVKGDPSNPASARMTWNVSEGSDRPAVEVRTESGCLVSDSPWNCPYTHRVYIRLGTLANDIRLAAERYVSALQENEQLLRKFRTCMQHMYPRLPAKDANHL